jgi:hypothetical protein
MPVDRAVVLTMSNEHPGVLLADADHFRRRSQQCLRLASQTLDPSAAVTLTSLAVAFESKARSLEKTMATVSAMRHGASSTISA